MPCIHSPQKEILPSLAALTCLLSLHYRLILQSLLPLPSSPLLRLLLSLHPISPEHIHFFTYPTALLFTSSLLVDIAFSPLHPPCFLYCSISIRNAASFMNSSGWSWTVRGGMQGGNKARRWLLEQTEERENERGRMEGVGGVAVLLNFNEYQGEFLPHIFFPHSLSTFFFFFFLGCTHLLHGSKSLSHKWALTQSGFGLDSGTSQNGAIGYAPRKQRPESPNWTANLSCLSLLSSTSHQNHTCATRHVLFPETSADVSSVSFHDRSAAH